MFLLLFRIVYIDIILRINSNIFDNSVNMKRNILIDWLFFIPKIRRDRNALSSTFKRNTFIQRRQRFDIYLSILIRIFMNIYLKILLNNKWLGLIWNILYLWLKEVIFWRFGFSLCDKVPLKPLKRFIVVNKAISFTILIYFL